MRIKIQGFEGSNLLHTSSALCKRILNTAMWNYFITAWDQSLFQNLNYPSPKELWSWNNNLQSTLHQTPEFYETFWTLLSTTEYRLGSWNQERRCWMCWKVPEEQREEGSCGCSFVQWFTHAFIAGYHFFS